MSDWKNKLDELGTNDGDTGLHKAAAWNKLHERLQKKPSRKIGYWYGIAAAVAVIIIGLFWLSTATNETGIYVKEIVPTQPEKTLAPVEAVKDITEPSNNITSIKNNESARLNKKNNITRKIPIVQEPIDQPTDKQQVPEQYVVADIPVETIATKVDTVNLIATVSNPVVKKKMKVVRLNEINVSPEEQIEFNRTQAGSTIKQKTYRSGLFRSTFGNTQSGDDFIKIKLSPQN